MINRPKLVPLIALVFTLLSAPAVAAPTCQDERGATIRCGTDGAMPVGWKAIRATPDIEDSNEIVQWIRAACAVGVFFALLAAMPDFDGSTPGEWDHEENDETR